MVDIAIDPRTRDLAFRRLDNGKLAFQPVRGADEIAQRVAIHLRTWIGEWFLDSAHGVPYLESILGHGRRMLIVEAILRSHILSVEGVESITSFVMEHDRAERKLTVRWEAATPAGTARGWFTA